MRAARHQRPNKRLRHFAWCGLLLAPLLSRVFIETGFVQTSLVRLCWLGGCTATLVDIVGTMALLTLNPNSPGVSVELSTSYLSAAKEGETIVVEGKYVALVFALVEGDVDYIASVEGQYVACELPWPWVQPLAALVGHFPCKLCLVRCVRVTKSGARLGFTSVDLFRKSDGKLVATGRHTKAM